MKQLDLQWKEFSVSLPALKAAIDVIAPGKCPGLSGNSKLQVHLEEETSQEEMDAIQAHWESIDEEAEEAVSYVSEAELKAQADAALAASKASASAKLALLGLSEAEIAALLG